jgi:hypothetical protein
MKWSTVCTIIQSLWNCTVSPLRLDDGFHPALEHFVKCMWYCVSFLWWKDILDETAFVPHSQILANGDFQEVRGHFSTSLDVGKHNRFIYSFTALSSPYRRLCPTNSLRCISNCTSQPCNATTIHVLETYPFLLYSHLYLINSVLSFTSSFLLVFYNNP